MGNSQDAWNSEVYQGSDMTRRQHKGMLLEGRGAEGKGEARIAVTLAYCGVCGSSWNLTYTKTCAQPVPIPTSQRIGRGLYRIAAPQ